MYYLNIFMAYEMNHGMPIPAISDNIGIYYTLYLEGAQKIYKYFTICNLLSYFCLCVLFMYI